MFSKFKNIVIPVEKRPNKAQCFFHKTRKCRRRITKKVNPTLGFLGLLGFLGFLGFIPMTYAEETMTYPAFFFFFAGFGYFNLYYKGKMSGTLIDERFRLNESRASSLAYKIAFTFVIFINSSVIAATSFLTNHGALGVLIAGIGLALGLAVFLEQYLLYRYENEE